MLLSDQVRLPIAIDTVTVLLWSRKFGFGSEWFDMSLAIDWKSPIKRTMNFHNLARFAATVAKDFKTEDNKRNLDSDEATLVESWNGFSQETCSRLRAVPLSFSVLMILHCWFSQQAAFSNERGKLLTALPQLFFTLENVWSQNPQPTHV
jgi:hypothetical protein